MATSTPAATKQIRVDLEVYEALRSMAMAWQDTPNKVLRGLLKLEENGD